MGPRHKDWRAGCQGLLNLTFSRLGDFFSATNRGGSAKSYGGNAKVFHNFGGCGTRPSAEPGRAQTSSPSAKELWRIPKIVQAALLKIAFARKR